MIRKQMIIASGGQSIRPLIERLQLLTALQAFVGLDDVKWVSHEVISARPPLTDR